MTDGGRRVRARVYSTSRCHETELSDELSESEKRVVLLVLVAEEAGDDDFC